MAEDKKGFILYADLIHTVEHLTDEQAGNLFKHILSYVSDRNPVAVDPITKITFEPIKQQLKRDLEKWGTTREGRSKAGKASAEARRIKKEQELTNSTNVKSVQQTSTNPTVSVNDNVNVSVNDNVINNNIPTFEDFKMYAWSKKKDVNMEALKLKYESWVENGWKDGNDKPIKNWKTKILNSLPYLKERKQTFRI